MKTLILKWIGLVVLIPLVLLIVIRTRADNVITDSITLEEISELQGGSISIGEEELKRLGNKNITLTHEMMDMIMTTGTATKTTVDDLPAMQAARETLDSFVNTLCKSGDVCRVKGHSWRDGRPGEEPDENGLAHLKADYNPGTVFQTCRICDKVQSQSTMEWKDN